MSFMSDLRIKNPIYNNLCKSEPFPTLETKMN